MKAYGATTIALSIALFSSSVATVGPTSVLYLTNSAEFATTLGGTGLDRIQGSTVLSSSWTAAAFDYPIVVAGDVRTCGTENNFFYKGALFDLNGNAIAYDQYHYNGPGFIYDGTSDGAYNYSIEFLSGNVYRFDRNWANETVMFGTAQETYSGITLSGDGTLWLTNYADGAQSQIVHYAKDGTFLGSFGSGVDEMAGLAYDPADGTLWCSNFLNRTLTQFSLAGTMLQQVSYHVDGEYWYGLEFNETQAVPEPASLTALTLGCLAIAKRRKKKTMDVS